MSIDVMKQALEALKDACGGRCNAEYNPCWQQEAAQALRLAIEQAEKQEPGAYGATHRQLITGALYKRIDGMWYVWSRFEDEPESWIKSPGTQESCLEKIGTAPQPQTKQEPVAWTPITEPYPPGGELDILMGDGSVLCGVLPQADGDLWWNGSGTGEKFIDPQYANVTHWRIHSDTAPPQRQPLTDEEIDSLELPPSGTATVRDIVRLIERAHGIGDENV